MKMELMNNDKLTPTMDRVRSGRTQLFREKDPNNRTFINDANCDVSLVHRNKEMYAKLIDGKWYWVSGCAECNGEERNLAKSYIECEEHDRCEICGIKAKDLKENIRQGTAKGWICNSCHKTKVAERRRLAFEKFNREEHDDCDFSNNDEIICPHCGSIICNDDIYESQDLVCPICDGEISLEVNYTPSYSTSIKGDRVTE